MILLLQNNFYVRIPIIHDLCYKTKNMIYLYLYPYGYIDIILVIAVYDKVKIINHIFKYHIHKLFQNIKDLPIIELMFYNTPYYICLLDYVYQSLYIEQMKKE